MGVVQSVGRGAMKVIIEIATATKIDTRRKVPAWEESVGQH
jgi:hypothetical protein